MSFSNWRSATRRRSARSFGLPSVDEVSADLHLLSDFGNWLSEFDEGDDLVFDVLVVFFLDFTFIAFDFLCDWSRNLTHLIRTSLRLNVKGLPFF